MALSGKATEKKQLSNQGHSSWSVRNKNQHKQHWFASRNCSCLNRMQIEWTHGCVLWIFSPITAVIMYFNLLPSLVTIWFILRTSTFTHSSKIFASHLNLCPWTSFTARLQFSSSSCLLVPQTEEWNLSSPFHCLLFPHPGILQPLLLLHLLMTIVC